MKPPAVEVLIVTRLLRAGGAERQAMVLAGHLAEEGRAVGVLAFRPDPEVALPTGVRLLLSDEVGVTRDARWRRATAPADRVLSVLTMRASQIASRQGVHPSLRRAAHRSAVGPALRGFGNAGRTIRRFVESTGATSVVAFLPSMYCAATLGLWDLNVRLIASYRNDPTQPVIKAHWRGMQHLVAERADVFGANTLAGAAWVHEQLAPRRQAAPVFMPNILAALPVRLAPATRRFIVVSRLVAVKRVDAVVYAFAALRDELPDWELIIAGDGPERPALEQLIEDLGLCLRCRMLGQVPVEPLLSEGGVLVHPSTMEGTPNAVMEAMSHGISSIVTAGSPGPVELVAGTIPDSSVGPAGVVIPPDDTVALAEAMRTVAAVPGIRDRLAANARTRAERMTWPVLREEWLRIIDGSDRR